MAKQSLRERLQAKQKDLKSKSGGFKTFMVKVGTTKYRPLFCGEDEDWAVEVITFYLGQELGYLISPASFGEKCAFMKAHKEMSEGSPEDREFAKKRLNPTRKFALPAIRYNEDTDEVDTQNGAKPLIIAPGTYDDMLDLWLDKDNGDFTHPIDGYDIKIKREGTGKKDTKYSVLTGKHRKVPKEFRGPYNIEEMLKESVIPSYKETKELLDKYLNLAPQDDDSDDEKPKKKKKKNRDL